MVLPHFPWSRFLFGLQEANRRSQPNWFTAQITESADEAMVRLNNTLNCVLLLRYSNSCQAGIIVLYVLTAEVAKKLFYTYVQES